MSNSLTEISNSLNRFDDRLSALEADARETSGLIRNIADSLYSMNLKLDAIEKMQAKHGSQLDHASAFARHSTARLDKHLAELGMVAEKIQEQVETVGADMHEYARMAYDAAYGSDEPVEIDWDDVDRRDYDLYACVCRDGYEEFRRE